MTVALRLDVRGVWGCRVRVEGACSTASSASTEQPRMRLQRNTQSHCSNNSLHGHVPSLLGGLHDIIVQVTAATGPAGVAAMQQPFWVTPCGCMAAWGQRGST